MARARRLIAKQQGGWPADWVERTFGSDSGKVEGRRDAGVQAAPQTAGPQVAVIRNAGVRTDADEFEPSLRTRSSRNGGAHGSQNSPLVCPISPALDGSATRVSDLGMQGPRLLADRHLLLHVQETEVAAWKQRASGT